MMEDGSAASGGKSSMEDVNRTVEETSASDLSRGGAGGRGTSPSAVLMALAVLPGEYEWCVLVVCSKHVWWLWAVV